MELRLVEGQNASRAVDLDSGSGLHSGREGDVADEGAGADMRHDGLAHSDLRAPLADEGEVAHGLIFNRKDGAGGKGSPCSGAQQLRQLRLVEVADEICKEGALVGTELEAEAVAKQASELDQI